MDIADRMMESINYEKMSNYEKGLKKMRNLISEESTKKAILSVDHMKTISETNGNSEMSLDEINEEIKLTRIEKKQKKIKIAQL